MNLNYGIPVSSMIPTTDGLCRAGNLKVGDVIFSAFDIETKVISDIKHVGVKDIYRITTDSDMSFLISDDYPLPLYMNTIGGMFKVNECTAKDIIGNYKITVDGTDSYMYKMPYIDGVEYNHQRTNISPFVAGQLIVSATNSKYLNIYGAEKTASTIATEFGFKYVPVDKHMYQIKNRFGLPIRTESVLKRIGWFNNVNWDQRAIDPRYLMTSSVELLSLISGLRCNMGLWPWNEIPDETIFFTQSKLIAEQYISSFASIGYRAIIKKTSSGYAILECNRNSTIVSVDKMHKRSECIAIITDSPMIVGENYFALFTPNAFI